MYFKKISLFYFFISIFFAAGLSHSSDDFNKANSSFDKKDYATALTDYQSTLDKIDNKTDSKVSNAISKLKEILIPGQTSGRPNQSAAFACLQMGKCHLALKDVPNAIQSFGDGYNRSKGSLIGKECLAQKATWEIYSKKYSDALADLTEYFKDFKGGKEQETPETQRLLYYAMYCSYVQKDQTSLKNFYSLSENFIPKTDHRKYFRKGKP